MKKVYVWTIYDAMGRWCGYFLPREKELAMNWAKTHGGTCKKETMIFG